MQQGSSILLSQKFRAGRGKLAVLTTLFNPVGSARIVQNMREFIGTIKADIFVAEMVYGRDFELPANEHWLRVRGHDQQVLWQKERLLNLLLSKLPAEYTDVAWIDGDLYFKNVDWIRHAQQALLNHQVVQLYEKVHRLDQNGGIFLSQEGMVKYIKNNHISGPESARGSCGFAWAARREVLDALRLLDTEVLGDADLMMLAAFFGHCDPREFGFELTERWGTHVKRWTDLAFKLIGGEVGYVPGEIVHMYHGPMTSRSYVGRRKCLRDNNFDPATDIRSSTNGAWEWATDKPNLHQAVKAYFVDRNDDN